MSDKPADTQKRLGHANQHVRELEALYRISQVLPSAASERQKLAAVLDVLHSDLGMSRGAIALLSPNAQELVVEVAHNVPDSQRQAVRYKKGEGIVDSTSPEYELGSRWMGLSEPEYGIHGTNDASTIGKHITKGCVRMRNEDVEELYAIIPSGTEVTIVES